MLIQEARVVTPDGVLDEGWVHIENGRIAGVGAGAPSIDDSESVRLGGRWLGPGFIDPHIHGAGGADVMDGEVEGIAVLAQTLVRHGVTSFLPTTYTGSRDVTVRALRAIESARTHPPDGAQALGAHMEGPFLSAARAGAHPVELLHAADPGEVEDYLAAARILLIALAPEVPQNAALIPGLVARGITVSVGHSDATYDQVEAALSVGASVVTHLFNGMRPLHHREAGVAGGGLLLSGLTCELISDGVHVDARSLRVAWRLKGRGGIVLVSDAGRFAGSPSGDAEHDQRTEARDGAIFLHDGTLASSLSLLDQGFRTFCEVNELGFGEAWDVVSGNIARTLGLAGKGAVRADADADLTILEPDGRVAGTIVAGRFAHRAW